jgi:hypothetical protein
MTAPTFNGAFPHNWTAEALPNRPMILPNRHFVYPEEVEEVERGALEVLIQPRPGEPPFLATCALGFRDPSAPTGIWSMPHPDWLCAVAGGYAYLIDVTDPRQFTMVRYRPVLNVVHSFPEKLDSSADEQDKASANLKINNPPSKSDDLSSSSDGLLLFVGHHSILAWGRDGEAWESDRLSWEGITIDRIEGKILHGQGWDMMTDKDIPFSLDLSTGRKL